MIKLGQGRSSSPGIAPPCCKRTVYTGIDIVVFTFSCGVLIMRRVVEPASKSRGGNFGEHEICAICIPQ